MIKYLINKIRFLKYKQRFPHVRIAQLAHISTDSTIGADSVIGDVSYIATSKIGNSVNIHNNCSIVKSIVEVNSVIYSHNILHEAEIGRFTYFASGSHVSKAKFGSFCSVGPNLICGHGDHPTDFVSTSPLFFSTGKQCGVSFSQEDLFVERKEILVGHDVWIGARVFIRDGVKIGNGAIIAAGSVVVKDVPDYAIVGGASAKVIRYRFPEEIIHQLLKLKWWDWNESKLRQAQKYIASNDISGFIDWSISRNGDEIVDF